MGRVGPTYRDFVHDTLPREHGGFGGATYTNTTGRNELEVAKVARDPKYLYFYVRTAAPITGHDADRNWMTLFLNLDGDPSTGWEGYEYVVNRIRRGTDTTVVEASDGGWRWREVGEVPYRTADRELHLALPRSLLGRHARGRLHLQFKWSDNLQADGDVMDFYVNGDTAPDERFSFLYTEDRRLTSQPG